MSEPMELEETIRSLCQGSKLAQKPKTQLNNFQKEAYPNAAIT